ncbi:MAG: YybH family protein [Gemmatimonadales bacterium]
MRRPISLAFLLAVACTSAPAERVPAGMDKAQPLAAEDIAAIRATDSTFSGAMGAGDAAGLAAMYLPDAHLLPPNLGPVEGREAIQQFFAGFLNAYHVTIALSTDEIEGRADLAYARGHYTMEGTPKAAGTPPLREEGKFLEVLRRQADGSWRYAADMYSSNFPEPATK